MKSGLKSAVASRLAKASMTSKLKSTLRFRTRWSQKTQLAKAFPNRISTMAREEDVKFSIILSEVRLQSRNPVNTARIVIKIEYKNELSLI